MAGQRPGVDSDVEGMWAPALARGLLRDDVLPSMRYRDGYTDLLGPDVAVPRGMHGSAVATAYERLRRPIMVAAMRLHGISISSEPERAAAALRVGGKQRVLDVVCGTGDFTNFVAGRLRGDGFVIGLDNSVQTMARAVRDNSCVRAVYMRADAHSLPFNNRSFDMVCCMAALHLVPEPIGVLHEMVRVLAPGGWIVVITSYGSGSLLARRGLELGATICGVRVFDRTTLPAFFAAAGLTDIDQQLRGISQFIIARRPEQVIELDTWRTRSSGWTNRRRSIGH